jgi:hypothetical protein
VIFGLEVDPPLPDRWTPLEAVAVVKCLDEDGEMALQVTATPALTRWESLGMLNAAVATQLEDLNRSFIPDEGDEP